MAPPKGNKYALGSTTSGRKPKYDLEVEAEKLLEYSKRDDCICLEDFTDDKDYCASDLWYFASRSDVFSKALKKAKDRIGKRRASLCDKGLMNYGVWNRSARLYTPTMRWEEEYTKDEEATRKMKLIEHELKLKSQTEMAISKEQNEQFEKLMDQLKAVQSFARASDINNSNMD